MACFTVPLATAAVASAVKTTLPKSAEGNPFVSRLGWLGKMMFGGSPPFLTAAKEGPEAVGEMLHEMATRGVAMTVLLVAVWVAMVAFSVRSEKKASPAHV